MHTNQTIRDVSTSGSTSIIFSFTGENSTIAAHRLTSNHPAYTTTQQSSHQHQPPTSSTTNMEPHALPPPTSPTPPSSPYTHTNPSSPPPYQPAPKRAPTSPTNPPPRHQLDLLLLTSFPDNSALYWRPQWFPPPPPTLARWTLHNPPNVVTERLPQATPHSRPVYTRRMRRAGDPEPAYIKTWAHWRRVCALYGVPEDFLCEEQVLFMREGLERGRDEELCGEWFARVVSEGLCESECGLVARIG